MLAQHGSAGSSCIHRTSAVGTAYSDFHRASRASQPPVIQKKRAALNQKLRPAGKPAMKWPTPAPFMEGSFGRRRCLPQISNLPAASMQLAYARCESSRTLAVRSSGK